MRTVGVFTTVIAAAALIAGAATAIASLPELERYVRIKRM
jgi:hypothetical protein